MATVETGAAAPAEAAPTETFLLACPEARPFLEDIALKSKGAFTLLDPQEGTQALQAHLDEHVVSQAVTVPHPRKDILHNPRNANYFTAFDFFTRRLARYAAKQQHLLDMDTLITINNFTDNTILGETLAHGVDSFRPLFEALDKAERQLIPKLTERAGQDEVFARQIIEVASLPTYDDQLHFNPMQLLLHHDLVDRKESSLIVTALGHGRGAQDREGRQTFLRNSLEHPDEPESYGPLAFWHKIGQLPTQEAFIEALVENTGEWPEDLERQYQQQTQDTAEEVLAYVRAYAVEVPMPRGLEDLEKDWINVRQHSPIPLAGDRFTDSKAPTKRRVGTTKRQRQQITSTDTIDEGSEVAKQAEVIESLPVVMVKELTGGASLIVESDNNEEPMREMIDKFLKGYAGNEKLRRDLEAAIRLIRDPSHTRGVYPMVNFTVTIGNQKYQEYCLRLSKVTGQRWEANGITNRLRIRFIKYEGKIGLLNIVRKQDSTRTTKGKSHV
jgi:hypothetical protein